MWLITLLSPHHHTELPPRLGFEAGRTFGIHSTSSYRWRRPVLQPSSRAERGFTPIANHFQFFYRGVGRSDCIRVPPRQSVYQIPCCAPDAVQYRWGNPRHTRYFRAPQTDSRLHRSGYTNLRTGIGKKFHYGRAVCPLRESPSQRGSLQRFGRARAGEPKIPLHRGRSCYLVDKCHRPFGPRRPDDNSRYDPHSEHPCHGKSIGSEVGSGSYDGHLLPHFRPERSASGRKLAGAKCHIPSPYSWTTYSDGDSPHPGAQLWSSSYSPPPECHEYRNTITVHSVGSSRSGFSLESARSGTIAPSIDPSAVFDSPFFMYCMQGRERLFCLSRSSTSVQRQTVQELYGREQPSPNALSTPRGEKAQRSQNPTLSLLRMGSTPSFPIPVFFPGAPYPSLYGLIKPNSEDMLLHSHLYFNTPLFGFLSRRQNRKGKNSNPFFLHGCIDARKFIWPPPKRRRWPPFAFQSLGLTAFKGHILFVPYEGPPISPRNPNRCGPSLILWNTRGAHTQSKMIDILTHITQYRPICLVICETWLPHDSLDVVLPPHIGYSMQRFNFRANTRSATRASHGIAILVSDGWGIQEALPSPSPADDATQKAAFVFVTLSPLGSHPDLPSPSFKVSVLAMYARPHVRGVDLIGQDMRNVIHRCAVFAETNHLPFFALLDANASVGLRQEGIGHRLPYTGAKLGRSHTRGALLIQACSDAPITADLIIANGRAGLQGNGPTFRNSRGKSQIDYILTTTDTLRDMVTECWIAYGKGLALSPKADHDPVIIGLRLPAPQPVFPPEP